MLLFFTMKESQKEITADPILSETGQHRTRILIRNIVDGVLESKYEKSMFKAESSGDGLCGDRMSRIYRAKPAIDNFLDSITELQDSGTLTQEDCDRIKSALKWMMLLHVGQADRADGTGPYIKHPIEVAGGVLAMYKGDDMADVCIAALLHDAVEDKAELLTLIQEYKEHQGVSEQEVKEINEHGALQSLYDLFGARVHGLVEKVSVPLSLYEDRVTLEEKYIMYRKFVTKIVKDTADPAAFMIKWQDARANMLSIGRLWARARELEHQIYILSPYLKSKDGRERLRSLRAVSKKKRQIYKRLRNKYEPVLREIFLPAFENMNKEHPLYAHREQAVQDIQKALKEQYSLDS